MPKSGFVRPSGRTELPPKKVKRRTEGQFKTRVSSAYCAGVGYGFLNESAGNATTSLQRESVKNEERPRDAAVGARHPRILVTFSVSTYLVQQFSCSHRSFSWKERYHLTQL